MAGLILKSSGSLSTTYRDSDAGFAKLPFSGRFMYAFRQTYRYFNRIPNKRQQKNEKKELFLNHGFFKRKISAEEVFDEQGQLFDAMICCNIDNRQTL